MSRLLTPTESMMSYETNNSNIFKLLIYVTFNLVINECAKDNGNCSQICHDTETSYHCSCKHGYKMLNDSKTCEGNSRKETKIYCKQRNAEVIDVYRVKQLRRKLSYFIDINECDIIGKCSQKCTNTEGSYKCSCTSDYVLSPNGRSCNPTPGIWHSKFIIIRLFYHELHPTSILSLVNVKASVRQSL